MKLDEQTILFFARTMELGGTENVVLQLCEIFKPLVKKIVVCSRGGVNVPKLVEMGITHYEIGDPENKSLSNILSTCRELKRIVKTEKVTVIHTHHRMSAFYIRLTGLYKNCHFINTSHNTFSNRIALTKYAYKKANLIACGEMVKKNLVEVFGLDSVTVIHNAVKSFNSDIEIIEEFQNAHKNGSFLIGNVGRLSEQKGMEYFLSAIPNVLKIHPETYFYIIGSGEDEAKLKELADGLPVTFMGYRNDIQNLISQLDLVVLSSLWEGLPLTPIEAFSVKKSIVATSVDGTVEIVKDSYNGLLVPPKDPDSLSEKINWMIDHPTEREIMENNAKLTFDHDFSFDVLASNYINFYRSL